VAWAAFFNFIAFLVFGLHVAETVGRGIVHADIINERVIFGALAGAITWQIITNRLGIPSSSSHALIGGLVGAGLAKAGISAVVWQGVFKTISGIVLAPAWLRPRAVSDAVGIVDLRTVHAVRRGQLFPARTTGLGRLLRPGPRRE
jgi:hypothetical protein